MTNRRRIFSSSSSLVSVLLLFLSACNSGGGGPSGAQSIQSEKLTVQSADLLPVERRLKADGCQFRPKPNSRQTSLESLVCTFDPTRLGSSAVTETEAHLSLLQEYNDSVRAALADGSVRSAQKSSQLAGRMKLVEERRDSLKSVLRQVLDQEADVQQALGKLGRLGCGVENLKLTCPEPRDAQVAYALRDLLAQADTELAKLNDTHAPILNVDLAAYASLRAAIDSAKTRIQIALEAYERARPQINAIANSGPFAAQTGIKIEVGLIVSQTQNQSIANLIRTLENLIRSGNHIQALQQKAFRRIVITPLANSATDVAFGENDDAVVLPDSMPAAEALKFLLNTRAKANGVGAEHVAKLGELQKSRDRLKSSGILAAGEVGLSREAGRVLVRSTESHSKIQMALERLQREGHWTDEQKNNISIVAGEEFEVFGTTRWTVVIDTRQSVDRIAQELRGLLHNSQERLARLKAL